MGTKNKYHLTAPETQLKENLHHNVIAFYQRGIFVRWTFDH